MSFLQEKCSFGLFTRQQSNECKPFHCGDEYQHPNTISKIRRDITFEG